MLPLPMLQWLEPGLNKVLALDPATAARLPALAGRPLRVLLTPFNSSLTLTVSDGQLCFAGPETEAAITLTGSLQDFTQAALNRGEMTAGRLQVQGDVGAAQRWQQFFADLQPDWEEELSKYLGDIAGPQLANVLRSVTSWLKTALSQLQQTGVEYLQEESRMLVAPAELQAFLADVDRLRDDAERLLQKARLQSGMKSGAGL
ncbi:SCP2 domain-containing protein [Permianibacter sp. IMCC34836]|uniref:ubiquinone biosynthesis accessory factor UbiJ n=1 Tax=Permianibacter fluminis TaxID=2738515 RepID=UPI0015519FE5|nr:SCP2 sterol-binding domain-containing protein [Permianibacter fluminis]NQD36133.1 SCP2 domain-containing protein [Permianibacter fluminis]